MEIGKFNEYMKKFVLLDEIPNGMSKEIGLLTISEISIKYLKTKNVI